MKYDLKYIIQPYLQKLTLKGRFHEPGFMSLSIGLVRLAGNMMINEL